MPVLQIVNLTSRSIPVDSAIGMIPAGSVLTKNITVKQLEETGEKLLGLEGAGLISFSVIKSSDVDDRIEFDPIVLLGGSCKWTPGYGLPNRTDLVPSAYADNGDGVARVTVGSLGVPPIVTGSTVVIAGTTNDHYVGTWSVTVIDNVTIDLVGSVYIDNPAAKGTCITSGQVGSIGDLYSCLNGGAVTTLYVKTSGAATNSGWTAK